MQGAERKYLAPLFIAIVPDISTNDCLQFPSLRAHKISCEVFVKNVVRIREVRDP